MAQEDEVAVLRARYEKLARKLPPGSAGAENASEILARAEGFVESIAREEDPSKREGMTRAREALFLGAAEADSRMRPFMGLLCSYIRERVALARAGREPASPTDAPRTLPRTATPTRDAPLLEESRALADLRERFLERIMAAQRPSSWQQRGDVQNVILSLDWYCASIARNEAPQQREAMVRAVQGAFRSWAESDPSSELLAGLLTSYLRERVSLQMQSEPPFSDDAPRIVIRSLIIPGDRTKEGILVKGVSTLWFEILRRIKADPDLIHQIDCWKWEEIVAGAYNQEGWETVVLTPKRGDKGRDIIAERKDWGQLRFLLLDQVKSYAPDHLVGPDEIREMAGVLHRECRATKGIITTTSGFTPGAAEEAEYLFPRLELKPREKLLPWLASVAVERLRDPDWGNAAAHKE
jgi:restriction system protein